MWFGGETRRLTQPRRACFREGFPPRAPAAGLPSWQQRATTVKQLIDAGFTEKLFLSNDWYFGVTIAGTGAMDVMDKLNPDGMLFVTRKTLPYLKQIGVTDAQIRAITVDNPRRFFSGA